MDTENEIKPEWQENSRMEWALCSTKFKYVVQLAPKELNNIPSSQITKIYPSKVSRRCISITSDILTRLILKINKEDYVAESQKIK